MSRPTDRLLPPAELQALSRRSDLRGGIRLAAHLALLGGTGWLVAISGPWTLLPAMLALGIVQTALFAPAHETMHRTAFASRRANAVVFWLTACPALLNAQFFNAFHLAHHRHTQIAGADPELGVAPPSRLTSYAARVAGIPYWRRTLLMLADCWRGDLGRYSYITAQSAPGIIRSVRAMTVVMLLAAAGSAVLVGWWAPLVYWIGPQLLGRPFLVLYLLAEHTGCTKDDNGLTNTRTMMTNWLVRLLMWNMAYHTEHHLYPSVPFHRLADAHAALRTRLGVIDRRGYARWNAAFIRSLAKAPAVLEHGAQGV
ncbi:MAG TPA: fatty acid desaturase [Stellaceae bacterium]|nr:fatty acid desaturase [Stellaceae bacterium]